MSDLMIAAAGGFITCGIPGYHNTTLPKNEGISELLGLPRKGNEELWGPQRPSCMLAGPLLRVGGWDEKLLQVALIAPEFPLNNPLLCR